MYMHKHAWVILGLLSGFSAEAKDLARVAILTFEDQTGTKDYGYLPQSLTEAVDKSLQKKFDYVREDPAKSEEARRTYGLGKILSAEDAAAFAQRNHYDIVIFGAFAFDAQKKEIVVKTFVSLGSKEKFRALKERKNPVDATIFSLTEKVADDIVAEMTEVARSRSTEQAPGASEKLELHRDSSTSWEAKKWRLSLGLGIVGPADGEAGLKDGPSLTLAASRDIWRRLFVTAELGNISTERADAPKPIAREFDATYAAAAVGYAFYPGNRWRIFADLGLGLTYGSFREDSLAGKVDQLRTIIRIELGVDFLILQSFAFGLSMRGYNFPGGQYDYPSASPGLRLIYVF
jgi:TolB-like protein